ncbi:MAG TPA: imidazole glycerol phosphate synthase subunit HisH [Steroidobacteraceae bacterium]|nr:imidazole glycerol phosphate synthase subunit HisH [Steroidobacteraceae bacterium]
MRLVIIDSGGANLASLKFAFERLGCLATVTADASAVRDASHVVLPGVGAAADAMSRLHGSGLAQVIPTLRQPVLGICLGMQLLFERSDEGDTTCLGAIAGRATRMHAKPGLPVPHMGWNQLTMAEANPLLRQVQSGEYAYFVHSYRVAIAAETVATCHYDGAFSAVVASRNFFGTQFHPERSAGAGSRILANFLRLG